MLWLGQVVRLRSQSERPELEETMHGGGAALQVRLQARPMPPPQGQQKGLDGEQFVKGFDSHSPCLCADGHQEGPGHLLPRGS